MIAGASRLARLVLVLAAATLLAGAGCPSRPEPPPIPEKVLVPVPISCLDAPIKRPQFMSDAEFKAMDDYHAMLALWLDRRLRGLYELQLEAAMAGCWMPKADGL